MKRYLPYSEKPHSLCLLLFLRAVLLQTRTKLQKALKRVLNCCKLSVIFKSQNKFFCFKDQIPKELNSGVVYKFLCVCAMRLIKMKQ